MRTTKIRILRWTAICSIPAIAVVAMGAAVFFRDKDRAYARIEGKSTVIPSPFGDIEYTQGGAGPPVLVIHGGGGCDQGELLVQACSAIASTGSRRRASATCARPSTRAPRSTTRRMLQEHIVAHAGE
jgi:hypothetical protein